MKEELVYYDIGYFYNYYYSINGENKGCKVDYYNIFMVMDRILIQI